MKFADLLLTLPRALFKYISTLYAFLYNTCTRKFIPVTNGRNQFPTRRKLGPVPKSDGRGKIMSAFVKVFTA